MLLLKEHEKEREGPLQLLQSAKAALKRIKPGVRHSKVTTVGFYYASYCGPYFSEI